MYFQESVAQAPLLGHDVLMEENRLGREPLVPEAPAGDVSRGRPARGQQRRHDVARGGDRCETTGPGSRCRPGGTTIKKLLTFSS